MKCPAKGCTVMKEMKGSIWKQISVKHPDFQWKCRRCPKNYASHEGRYKHELKH